jgi:hypothetical protein
MNGIAPFQKIGVSRSDENCVRRIELYECIYMALNALVQQLMTALASSAGSAGAVKEFTAPG